MQIYKSTFYLQIIIYLFIHPYLMNHAYSVEKTTGKTINRRVLILDFYNSQKKEAYGFLETSIPDAVEGPLKETKSFELLERSRWSNFLNKGIFRKGDERDEKKAQEAGLKANADVVVMGQFAIMGTSMNITAKAIETQSGRIAVSKSKVTKTDGSMFTKINQLASELAAEMKEKLPPLEQKEIIKVKDSSSFIHSIYTTAGAGIMQPLYDAPRGITSGQSLYINSDLPIFFGALGIRSRPMGGILYRSRSQGNLSEDERRNL